MLRCSSGNNSWPSLVGDCFKVSDNLLLGPVLKPVVTTDDSHWVWNYIVCIINSHSFHVVYGIDLSSKVVT